MTTAVSANYAKAMHIYGKS